ncbi:UbiA family prenyltransferase [Streptomyces endophyticus]|uniref:UbiA family prenyltransferase n=1 Tax=Streptomyces endophyticus TaxID=714166 RepID=A0ABU6FK68_9ACTN|nr:UbiA family prenyltransferase [Streptomyces endophyticus]
MLRFPALFTVPGDALAGAAATGSRPTRGTLLAIGASVSLYAAGMTLNDWADRDEDARDRPHRPLPSGRVRPAHALAAAGVLTGTGLALACRAGRTTGALATALAATVWAYDLRLKGTAAGPAAMGAARGLDLLMGAAASAPAGSRGVLGRAVPAATAGAGARGVVKSTLVGATEGARASGIAGLLPAAAAAQAGARGGLRAVRAGVTSSVGVLGPLAPALTAAATLAVHTTAVTTVSRTEAQGGSSAGPLEALAVGGAIAATLLTTRARRPLPEEAPPASPTRSGRGRPTSPAPITVAVPAAVYAVTALRPLLHAALNPSPPLTQRAVGAGIRALVPLQSALSARSGAPVTALATLALAPLARRFAKRVSVT